MDYQCFRDVLNYLNNKLETSTYSDFPNSVNWKIVCSDGSLLKTYSKETIKYTLIKLLECGFIGSHGGINKETNVVTPEFIDNITERGHNFLINAANENVWKMTIGIVHDIGKISLPVFCRLLNKCAIIISHEHMKRG